VFPQWHIRSNAGFVLSFFVIVGLGVAYEWLRAYQRTVDVKIALYIQESKGKARATASGRSSPDDEVSHLLTGRPTAKGKTFQVPSIPRAIRAILYGATIFLSFFLMLVFMTYNAYLILAVVVGAALGHYVFGGQMDVEAVLYGSGAGKGMACH